MSEDGYQVNSTLSIYLWYFLVRDKSPEATITGQLIFFTLTYCRSLDKQTQWIKDGDELTEILKIGKLSHYGITIAMNENKNVESLNSNNSVVLITCKKNKFCKTFWLLS